MATNAQDSEFAETMKDDIEVKNTALDTAIQWIGSNLEPNDVFTEEKLIAHFRSTSSPDDVFTEDELGEWAVNNGYTSN